MIYKHESGDNVFFTADQHFGHENIIKYCSRPFATVEDMDNAMIEAWNKVVPKDGLVCHLGDFCLGNIDDALPYFLRLNGKIRILSVPWHHDRRWLPDFMDRASVLDVHFWGAEAMIKIGEDFVHLSHYPLGEWDRKHYGAYHLHGHSHGNFEDKGRMLDVGVDTHGQFAPWTWHEIVGVLKGERQP